MPGCAELFYTERAHLRALKVLDNVFHQRMNREAILPPADIKNIFTNLDEIVQLHGKNSEPYADVAGYDSGGDVRSGGFFKFFFYFCLVLTVSITEHMTAIRKKNEAAVVDLIGDDLLSWVRKMPALLPLLHATKLT